jgi:uncharacterized membrane protein
MKMLQFTTILFAGLVAGVMYAYSCSVNPGLKLLADAEYLKAMQGFNIAIQNPFFFIPFMGILLLYPITIYQMYQPAPSLPFYLFIISMVIYFIGVFGITIFCNVPLNEQLAGFSIASAAPNEIAAMRNVFEMPWNTFHTVRTLASILSFSLLIVALLVDKKVYENL